MSAKTPSLRTPLGRVRGLGAGKHGTGHFLAQRVSAIALVPLTIWFVYAIAAQMGAPHGEAFAFLAHPVNAALMALFALTGVYHFMLGLQVVIEDYITGEAARFTLLLLNRFAAVALGAVMLFALLKIAL